MKKRLVVSLATVSFILMNLPNPCFSEELPVPTYRNSVIVSVEHSPDDFAEVDYIKNNFNFGLYAWLSFSRTALIPALGWHWNLDDASNGIQSFKDSVNYLIEKAREKNVRLHLVLCSGLARGLAVYREAKEEDIRNSQWYNDNKLASDTQITDPGLMDVYAFGTLSRYARKVRANLEAKAKAALTFLKQKMDENPETLIALSGWGEAELNFGRLIPIQSLQDYFCDYSPFAVLEFRDWICHTGMYDDAAGKYKGQGYAAGGTKYQGAAGIAHFNADFGTNFATWDLKYFNWRLEDAYDSNPVDDVNPDPNKIPYSSYSHGNMMPSSGEDYIARGFDPPRVMEPGVPFWDLWNLFRETMVHNFVMDMARWVAETGIDVEKWYSHQIPADYLYGTKPDSPYKNARYFTSASPLWTANILPYGSAGATIYDNKFPDRFARTTQYAVPAISSMSSNWAIMEYDAETYPPGLDVTQSSSEVILEQYLRLYTYNVHLINFFLWWDETGEHRIKGMNKETALREFILRIRDNARRTDLTTVFTPPKVVEFSGMFLPESGEMQLELSGRIWQGHAWKWKDWGDFSHFEIYRSTDPGFTPGAANLLATTTEYVHKDKTVVYGNAYFYRVRAVNVKGSGGPYSDEIMLVPATNPVPILSLNKNKLNFAAEKGKAASLPQNVFIINLDNSGTTLNWQAAVGIGWLQVNPASGTGNGYITISVSAENLGQGSYSGEVQVTDPNAFNSPQRIEVTLTVYESGESSLPFGHFDTPADGAAVFGSVPVTGWALDDIEVVRVEVKRSPHPLDNPIVIGADGLVFIGNAVFVEGARPDVANLYPTYPLNSRAGWGYMLLTNMLPNYGNGLYTLYAIAYDKEGNSVTLGQKTISCNNADSKLPFGAIDTPAQGGTASGLYTNFGWALTPQPNMIPTDGSTINVWVDGVAIGRPVYNNYRSDIANKFPGYANTDGAVGYYYLDTTAYANGVHTIAWSVVDNGGNATGIGSRFFTIFNSGTAMAGVQGESVGTEFSGVQGEEGNRYRVPVFRLHTPLSWAHISSLPVSFEPVAVRRGYELEAEPEVIHPDPYGVVSIEIPEVERVEVHLGWDRSEDSAYWFQVPSGREDAKKREKLAGGSGGSRATNSSAKSSGVIYTGYMIEGDELKPLPIGSTLDTERGIFYWQPGPGFIGTYEFVFVKNDTAGRAMKTRLRVDIRPKF